jgi:hypothetical protein
MRTQLLDPILGRNWAKKASSAEGPDRAQNIDGHQYGHRSCNARGRATVLLPLSYLATGVLGFRANPGFCLCKARHLFRPANAISNAQPA